MRLLVLFLILFAQMVLLLAVTGLTLALSKFRFPLIVLFAIWMIAEAFSLALQFWWLFGIWLQTFVLGAVGIALSFLVVGLITQVVTNTLSPDKSIRANVMSILLGQASQNLFFTLANLASFIALALIMYQAYRMSLAKAAGDTIKNAVFLYFTLGSLPGLILGALQTTRSALNSNVDPVVRNLLAINSLGAYGFAGWRAAFPFFLFGGTMEFLGYDVGLYTVLIVLGSVYTAFVIIPLICGERLYTEERRSVLSETDQLP